MSLLPVEAALERLLAQARPIAETERLPLRAATNRVLAEPVVARRTQPAFAASAMDGWAVRAADLAEALQPLWPVGEAAAGRAFDRPLGPGETVRIFTGAPLPEGADAILIQENATTDADGRVVAAQSVAAGQHVRSAGVDFSAGETLLETGALLSPGAIALSASAGYPDLALRRRPRVAVLATGDELVAPGEPVGPAQIVASNSFGVAAMVENAGAEAIDCGIAGDEAGALARAFDRAVDAGADILVTIGGASVGDHDLVAPALQERGITLDFWKVAMRPGKPLMAGHRGDLRVLGLPGNPGSALVTARLFLRPLVERLAGRSDRPLYREGYLLAEMGANGPRTDFARATATPDTRGVMGLAPLPRQDSSLLTIFAAANALVVRPPGAEPAEAGEACRFVPL